ncbi:amino acid permease [Geopsychrobacter electrodiphilus]|uniref:amino acid permease n=1 Tax=Geopsychrobacter electrodiphilus TaxID=225196 RepID=UPI00036B186E|nr:amino acid permease [Geopsychrobacter electrodiphilus]
MLPVRKQQKLKKELGLFSVYAIATGTTLSAGFFLLPGIAASQAGPAMVLAYMLAAIPLIPAMFSIVELCTAMPKAGGVYYFLDRSLGPLFGTIGGMGTWLALILKVSFALMGMGYYLALFIPEIGEGHIRTLAVILALAIGVLNLFGSKKSGRMQIYLVFFLLALLAGFIGVGLPSINPVHFDGFFGAGFDSIISTAGLVYISYVGVTTVTSLSEEVRDPEKNLPRGVFLSLLTALVVYGLGTAIMVGVLPMAQLAATMTPVADATAVFFSKPGLYIMSFAAVLAFTSVANAGTMSASRYPLALSRDSLLPSAFSHLRDGVPVLSILVTVGSIVMILLFLDPLRIAKLASAFQLLMFALICFTVIVMRESGLDSYDPGYRSPFYPWMQLVGIFAPLWFIVEMGWLPTLFTVGLIFVGTLWYRSYARLKVQRSGAIFHIFARLGRLSQQGLDYELREIMKEKGLRQKDPFDQIIASSYVVNLAERTTFEVAVEVVSEWFADRIGHSPTEIGEQFLEGTRVGATPVARGVALPHFRTEGIEYAHLAIVRAPRGLKIDVPHPLQPGAHTSQLVQAVFFLISPEDNPALHLRLLAQIAGLVENEGFAEIWQRTSNEQEIKELLLRDENCLSMILDSAGLTARLIGRTLDQINLPQGSLVALLRRGNDMMVPRSNTLLLENDRMTIIGEPEAIHQLRREYLSVKEGRPVED